MCGIAGFWTPGFAPEDGYRIARSMADALRHRGPDDDGYWVDPETGIALGHRRLSIIDLSPRGRQPMLSHGGRYVIAFNGEIYNHRRLRVELAEGVTFTGHSDTEVMLAAIETWGLREALGRFIGMFAFALWDRKHRQLHLVRDRLGIKPLYYGWVDGAFLFGSELRALAAYPRFAREIDRDALALLLRHNCIPAPYSIYRSVWKLLPGTILTLPYPDARDRSVVPFWSAKDIAEGGGECPRNDNQAVEELDFLLRDAVALRMVADVPLGAFLSGGIDSSVVVAMMQAQSTRRVKTFCIGVADDNYDEAKYAAGVAQHLGTDHTQLYVTAQEALAVVPELPAIYDEPFADSSQIPTFIVSRLARQEVTIALSGDGGDELFAGYTHHLLTPKIWNRLRPIPLRARAAVARIIAGVPLNSWDRILTPATSLMPAMALNYGTPGYKLHKFADVISAATLEDMNSRLVSHWRAPSAVVLGAAEPQTALSDPRRRVNLEDATERMLYSDLITYLPDDILTKVDRASMAVSLEARVPLLDHRVVEFTWRLPLSMKIRDGQQKWLLRRVLERYVPRSLTDRPKSGFSIPLGDWLQGPLRSWAEALLEERRLREEGFLNPMLIRQRWSEHLSGRRNWHYHLWDVLMFQAWLERTNAQVQVRSSREPIPLDAAPA